MIALGHRAHDEKEWIWECEPGFSIQCLDRISNLISETKRAAKSAKATAVLLSVHLLVH